MNKITLFISAITIAIFVSFTACTTDPIEPLGPSLTFEDGVDAVTVSDSVAVDSFFLIKVSVNKGTGSLNTIEVQENGVAIDDFSRLDFNGFPAGSNPSPLGASDTAALNWDLRIKAPSTEGENTYTIIVTDINAKSDEGTVTVTSFIPFTPVDTNSMVLRLGNRDSKDPVGGLDLDTGMETGTVGVGDTLHDLQDLGIDVNMAVDWIQKFRAANGAELRKVENGTDFAGVEFKEQVEDIYNNATTIPNETDVVQVGDLFAVKVAAGTIYFLRTDEVSVTPTPGDNDDFYRFSAKW